MPARATRILRRHPVGAFLTWLFTVGQAIAFVPLGTQQLTEAE
jgi:hypothetical protein